MTDLERTPEETEAIRQEARQFLGLAVASDPIETYDAMGSPRLGRIPFETSVHFGNIFMDRYGRQRSDEAHMLMLHGMSNISGIVRGGLAAHGRALDQDAALRFITNPESVDHIAAMALRKNDRLESLLHRPGDAFRIHPSEAFIEMNPAEGVSTKGGCPEAGHDGIVDPTPIFTRFTDWSGRLIVTAVFKERAEGNDTPTVVAEPVVELPDPTDAAAQDAYARQMARPLL
jgi:hypothetical protein